MRHSQIEIEDALQRHAPAKDALPVSPRGSDTLAAVLVPDRDRSGLRRLLSKQIVPLAVMILLGWLLWGKAAHLDRAAILATVSTVKPVQWTLAALAAAISFWAIGQYDRVLHAQLGTGISDTAARRSGIVAIGLSQTLGFGALTGTLIRWRMLPELSLWQAARLSAAVALSFLTGWAVVAAMAMLVFQPDVPWMKTLALGAIMLFLTIATLSIYPPRPIARLTWPSLRTMGTVVGLAAIDTIFAGLALYVLLPEHLLLPLGHTIAAYLFSLGAGLISSTPGGVGPFEATLASLLPDVPLEPLLGGVIAFRMVYYALPATLSALLLIRGPRRCNLAREPHLVKTTASPFLPPQLEVQIFAAPRAEAGLLRTRDFSLLSAADGTALGLVSPIGQSLVMLSDPLGLNCPQQTRTALARAASRRYRMPAIYKCGARMAASARRAGWAVIPTSQEAWLTPAAFSLEGSKSRQLRRTLRKAEEGRLRVTEGGRDLPLDQMDRIAAEWRALRGRRERGFSMGTYDRDYISCQRVFLAWQGTNLVAFVSFHESRNEMTLDLMRSGDAAPEGTIHLLIVRAIEAAKSQGVPRLSLAAVPWDGDDPAPLTRWLRRKFMARSGAAGLRRFKAAFAPEWEPLYLAAPSRLALLVAGMDILRRITAPPPKPTSNPMKAARVATHPTMRLAGLFRRTPKRAQQITEGTRVGPCPFGH